MIFFDVTKTGAAGHRSGLTRVSSRLLAELGGAARPVRWNAWDERVQASDWYFTSELFSEEERPGFTAFLQRRPCRLAAVFHDAIPLKFPGITWPQSVARHPGYMKLLARFDCVWAVSEHSRKELLEFWRWQGIESPPSVKILSLGADFGPIERVTSPVRSGHSVPTVLGVGIVEPRKNQRLILDVAERLWTEGVRFNLRWVGRVNPHFGGPILASIKTLRKKFPAFHYHEAAGDRQLEHWYREAHVTVFPTIAEGCGLPLLESLWMGVPCLCSDLPVLRENAADGGCIPVPVNDVAAWADALRRILNDGAWHARLVEEAARRSLPTWSGAARALMAELR